MACVSHHTRQLRTKGTADFKQRFTVREHTSAFVSRIELDENTKRCRMLCYCGRACDIVADHRKHDSEIDQLRCTIQLAGRQRRFGESGYSHAARLAFERHARNFSRLCRLEVRTKRNTVLSNDAAHSLQVSF